MPKIAQLRSGRDSGIGKCVPFPDLYVTPHRVGHQMDKHMYRQRHLLGRRMRGFCRGSQKHRADTSNQQHTQPKKHFAEKSNSPPLRLCGSGPRLCKYISVNSVMRSSQPAACPLVNFFKESWQSTFRANSVMLASTKSGRKLKRLTYTHMSLCGSLER